eukprot:scaffold3347_cov110-Isochrysis_galbana.AAC.5
MAGNETPQKKTRRVRTTKFETQRENVPRGINKDKTREATREGQDGRERPYSITPYCELLERIEGLHPEKVGIEVKILMCAHAVWKRAWKPGALTSLTAGAAAAVLAAKALDGPI